MLKTLESIWQVWGTLFLVLEIIWVVGLSAWIIMERRSPAATMAWILGLSLLPLIGGAVYWLLGPRRLERRRFHYHLARESLVRMKIPERGRHQDAPPLPIPEYAPLAKMLCRLGEPPPTLANHLELIMDGDACYAAIESALQAAQHQIHLEFYIWENDDIGRKLRDLLAAKAAAGVEVRLLVDSIGSSGLDDEFFAPIRSAGGQCAVFNPIHFARWRPPGNFRTHRKIVVVDGRIGFVGGMNVSDRHRASIHGKLAWRDLHLRLDGPPVRWLQLVFIENWEFTTGSSPAPAASFPSLPEPDATTAPWVQIVSSGPDSNAYAIHRCLVAAINTAQKQLLVATPYFVPDEALLHAITSAAWRGVEVKLLVPRKGDSLLVTAAARSYFDQLSAAGVQVYEYRPAMLHAKALVVDGEAAIVGTANLDNRSFRLNFEVMVAIYNRKIAGELATGFMAGMKQTRLYRPAQNRRTPFYRRFFEATARLFSPYL